MKTLIMHPQNKEQLIALKAFAKALKVPFHNTKEEELTEREKGIKLYGKDLVEKIERAEKAIQEGEFITLDQQSNFLASESDRKIFFDAIIRSEEPNSALIEASHRYKKAVAAK